MADVAEGRKGRKERRFLLEITIGKIHNSRENRIGVRCPLVHLLDEVQRFLHSIVDETMEYLSLPSLLWFRTCAWEMDDWG